MLLSKLHKSLYILERVLFIEKLIRVVTTSGSFKSLSLYLNFLVILDLSSAENETASFPWSCSSLNGQCRNVCLPHEMFFGPLGCGKGFMCCVSHFL
uniref:Beta-defensin n=1 Tax=Oryzias latipes TaxID=8090 RepID=A0A3P9HI40_ORYLA